MLHTSRRQWRLFRLALCLVLALALPVVRTAAQIPTLTTVSDTVYRADGSPANGTPANGTPANGTPANGTPANGTPANGTPANGTLLISWPPFTTANASTIAGGSKSVVLGTNGSLTVQLAPNAGATPSGTVYTVTYKLSDGTVKTESWSVDTTSPETIAAVRTLIGTSTPLALRRNTHRHRIEELPRIREIELTD
jgi:hypothetical protein